MPAQWIVDRFSPLQHVLAGSIPGETSLKEKAERPALWPGAGQKLAEAVVKKVAVGTQIEALQTALSNTLTLWQGPPGTGKTRTIVALIASVVAAARAAGVKGPKVLATSQSNVAVDNILMGLLKLKKKPSVIRLGVPSRVTETLHKHMLQEAMLKHPEGKKAAKIREIAATETEDHKTRKHFTAKAVEFEKEAVEKVLATTDVIFATTVGSLDPRLQKLQYCLCIVDEAAQSTEPDTLCALSKAQAAVLVGDPAQLPPTVVSSAAVAAGLSVSLFERLVADGIKPVLLATQFRMHPGLAMYSSKAFYSGLLQSDPKPEDRERPAGLVWPSPDVPVAFVTSSSQEQSKGTSFENDGEARIVVEVVRSLLAGGSIASPHSVGIVTPYSGQVALLKDYFSDLGLQTATEDLDEQNNKLHLKAKNLRLGAEAFERSLEIRSVDGYQGREKEVIIMSAVRANKRGDVGFVADPRRLNVAITRARCGLIIVGDITTLKTNKVWQDYLEWLEEQGTLTSISELIPDRKFEVKKRPEPSQMRSWNGSVIEKPRQSPRRPGRNSYFAQAGRR